LQNAPRDAAMPSVVAQVEEPGRQDRILQSEVCQATGRGGTLFVSPILGFDIVVDCLFVCVIVSQGRVNLFNRKVRAVGNDLFGRLSELIVEDDRTHGCAASVTVRAMDLRRVDEQTVAGASQTH